MQKTLLGFLTPRVASSQGPTSIHPLEQEKRRYADRDGKADDTRCATIDLKDRLW